jgi:hypothetical protein
VPIRVSIFASEKPRLSTFEEGDLRGFLAWLIGVV